MPFYERGKVRIHYEEIGSGFPLFLVAGGGLNSNIEWFKTDSPFNPMAEFKSEYRCIAMDLRNADGGQSTGPLETERPWEALAEDQLGLLDHLGIDRFLIMGFCIGNPIIWNLLTRTTGRIVAAVSAQPSAVDPEDPEFYYKRNIAKWAPQLLVSRPDISREMVEKYLVRMYKNIDFVITASRDFVASCATPLLVLPDDSKAHPYVTGMQMVNLAPNAQVSLFPWKDADATIALAVRHVRTFLKAHTPDAR